MREMWLHLAFKIELQCHAILIDAKQQSALFRFRSREIDLNSIPIFTCKPLGILKELSNTKLKLTKWIIP